MYKLNIAIRKNLQERHLESVELDLEHYAESFRIKELDVFDKESYLVFSLEEIPEEKQD